MKKIKIEKKFYCLYTVGFYNGSEKISEKIFNEKNLIEKLLNFELSENRLLSKTFKKDFIKIKMNKKEFIYL